MDKLAENPFLRSLAEKLTAQSLPCMAILELTYGCNFRCVHCLNPTHKVLPHELRTEEWFRMLDEISDLGVFYLNVTGGELFTRPDVMEILARAKNLGFLIGINSNASRITLELAHQLEALPVSSVGLSLYGATREVYERMTAVPGSYDAFQSGIKAIAQTKIPVELRMPVTTLNYGEIVEAKKMAKDFGFDFLYSFDIEPGQDGRLGPLAYRLSGEEKVRLMSEIDPGELTTQEEVLNPPDDFQDCTCGRGEQFAVSPYGEMNFCVSFPHPKFDLKKGNVREGWEVLKEARKNLGPNQNYECPSCEFRPFCRQGRNDAWLETGDASRCLPHFKDWARREKQVFLSK